MVKNMIFTEETAYNFVKEMQERIKKYLNKFGAIDIPMIPLAEITLQKWKGKLRNIENELAHLRFFIIR